MNENPLLSIIIPVYNAEQYLSECIDSILNQSICDWELILVDDGSVDNSSEICKKYEKIDSRIKCIQQCNSGSSVARNSGIFQAKGKYISFVDADDWVEKIMFEKLIECAESDEAEIVICNHYHVYQDGETILQPKSGFGKWIIDGKNEIDIYLRKYLCKGVKQYRPYLKMGQPWGRIYLRKILVDNNIIFPEGLARTEDGIFNMYAAESSTKIIFLDEGLYYYRVLGNSISHSYYPNIVANTERDFLEVKIFAEKYKKNDTIFIKGINARITTWFYKYLACYFFNYIYLKENGYISARKEIISIRNKEPYKSAYKNVNLSMLTKMELLFVFCMKLRLIEILFIMVRFRERMRIKRRL